MEPSPLGEPRLTFSGVQAGESPLDMGPKQETSGSRRSKPFKFVFNLLVGTLAGSYYFILPIYMWIKNLIWPKNAPGF